MEGKGKDIAVGTSIDKSSVESHKYYLARRTTMEMLRDRGYDVSDEDINLSFQDFRALYGEYPDVDQLRISAQHLSDSSKKGELFQITDLLVNVTKHVLRPKHQVLNDKEKESLLNKFNIEEKQLPVLSKNDAIARYYGLEKGKVVKVTYKGELSESHVIYRCVS